MSVLKDIPEFIYQLPTKATVLIGYDKLIKKGCSKDKAALQVTLQLIDTWKKADCPCLDQKLVKKKVLERWLNEISILFCGICAIPDTVFDEDFYREVFEKNKHKICA